MAGTGGPTVAKAYVAIIPTTKDAQKNISKSLIPQMESAADEAGEAGGESLIGRLGSAVKSGAAKVASAAKVAAGAGVAALGAMTVAATQNFGQWEQLSGGIEKIFDQMDTSEIFRDADQAYKNLGMSANQYLESMVSVGATFASTLGDKRGYEVAKQGMQAISDYASGTGKNVDVLTEKYTLITRASSQYQSIADQFSGILPSTSADFLTQAQAAGLLSTSYTKLTDVPLPEYQEAVTAMLTRGVDEMGLLGNTAAEASGTLEGSTNMMKASWDNLLTAFGRGDEEAIKPALDSMLSSVEAWGRNLIPRIGTILMSIVQEIPSVVALIVENLPGWLSEIGAAIQSNLPGMLAGVAETLGIDIESTLQAPIVQSVLALGDRVSEAFSQVFGDIDLSQTLADIQTGLSDLGAFFSGLFESASIEISKFLDSIDTASLAQGFETLRAVGEGLMSILGSVGEIAGTVFQTVILPVLSNLWDLWTTTIWPGLQDIFTLLQPILMTIGDMLVTGFDWLSKIAALIGDVLGPIIDTVFEWLAPKISEIIDDIKIVLTLIGEDFQRTWNIIKPIIDIIIDQVSDIFQEAGSQLERIWHIVETTFNLVKATVSRVISDIIQRVSGIAGDISGAFWNVVSGVSNALSNVYDIVTAPFRDAFNAIKRWWNNTVGGFSFTVPSWIPGVGGKSFKIPKLATGGDITTAGTVMVGEAGPELLSLPRGARVTPLSDAAPQGDTYSVVVGDVDLTDDDQVRRVTREYLEFLARLAAPTSMVTA